MPCFVAQSFAFASGNSFFTDSHVQKHKNSAGAEFLDSLLLVVAQGFAFAVFATLICQINSVFPCKDTKAQNRLCAEFLDSLLLVVAQSLRLWHRALLLPSLQL